MKALIDNVQFNKEFESKFGTLYNFTVSWYDENEQIQKGFYSSKKREQDKFKPGEESEFNIEEKKNDKGTYYVIKPISKGQFSGFNRNLKKEQSRYSGFAVSYCKDLIVSGHLPIEQWEKASKKIFNFMVELDKSIES